MTILPIIAILCVMCILSFSFVLSPLWQASRRFSKIPDGVRRYGYAWHERERILENLKDLEQDKQSGKISNLDAEPIRLELLSEASRLYREIEEREQQDEFLRWIKEREASSP